MTVQIESFATAAGRCESAAEIDALLLTACADDGYPYLRYGNFLSRAGFEGGVRFDTFPAAWGEAYMKENLASHDPALKGLFFATSAFGWGDYISNDAEADVIDRAAAHGMTNGVIYPVRIDNDFYALSMAGAKEPADPLQRAIIAARGTIYHTCRVKFETKSERAEATIKLSPTQLICLCMVAEGFSIDAIAGVRGTTPSAVNKALKEGRDQLGAANTTFAVAKAIAYGLIHPAVVQPWMQE